MKIKGFGKAEQETIEKFEQQIGFSLPEDYKQFLREYNGNSTRGNTFFVEALNEEIPLHVLFGINIEKNLDLQTWNNEYKDDLVPNSIIIGHDPGSGLIVLVNDPEVKGIYYWDHTFYFSQSSEEENTYKIADSFQAFIEGLKN